MQDADYYSYTEAIPDGPTTRLLQDVARQHHIVIIAPMYEEEQPGLYYNTAAVIDADGTYLGKYRKHHIPQVKGFWEKFFFRPGNLGYPVFDTALDRSACTSATTGTSPRAARARAERRRDRVHSVRDGRGPLAVPGKLEQPAHAVANGYSVGAFNRVGTEAPWNIGKFDGTSYIVNPRGQFLATRLGRQERARVRGVRPRPD